MEYNPNEVGDDVKVGEAANILEYIIALKTDVTRIKVATELLGGGRSFGERSNAAQVIYNVTALNSNWVESEHFQTQIGLIEHDPTKYSPEYIRFVVAACILAARDLPYLGKYKLNAKTQKTKEIKPIDHQNAVNTRLVDEYNSISSSFANGEIDLRTFQAATMDIATTLQALSAIQVSLGISRSTGVTNTNFQDSISDDLAKQRALTLVKFLEENMKVLIDDDAKLVAQDVVVRLKNDLNLDFDINAQPEANKPGQGISPDTMPPFDH